MVSCAFCTRTPDLKGLYYTYDIENYREGCDFSQFYFSRILISSHLDESPNGGFIFRHVHLFKSQPRRGIWRIF